ncbi:uncharacterized protein LOC109792556 [Cajanus cajan]|uniref:uncharacterized protein LOC109792556 n=1 Tax=Cajanus cajan TaxID=3821 RepID=UPI00098DA7C4|nr:uncharacterized protein LOC109792556 [Cajanus cajan]
MGNGEIVQANGKGTISIATKKGMIIVKDVLYIPKLDQNVLSVAQMLRNGYGVSFKENYCFIMDEHGLEIAKIEMTKNSFYLKFDLVEDHDFIAKIDESNVWHGRFGHTFMHDVFDMTNSNKWYSKTRGGVRLNDYEDNDMGQEIDVQQLDDMAFQNSIFGVHETKICDIHGKSQGGVLDL